jgi:hypothetical protein
MKRLSLLLCGWGLPTEAWLAGGVSEFEVMIVSFGV